MIPRIPRNALALALAATLLAAAPALSFAQAWRIRAMERARGRTARDAGLVGVFTMLAKPAQAAGVLRYWRTRLTGRRSTLIEYKGAPAPAAEGPDV